MSKWIVSKLRSKKQEQSSQISIELVYVKVRRSAFFFFFSFSDPLVVRRHTTASPHEKLIYFKIKCNGGRVKKTHKLRLTYFNKLVLSPNWSLKTEEERIKNNHNASISSHTQCSKKTIIPDSHYHQIPKFRRNYTRNDHEHKSSDSTNR